MSLLVLRRKGCVVWRPPSRACGALAELAGCEPLLRWEENARDGFPREHEHAVRKAHADEPLRVAEDREELGLLGDRPVLERPRVHAGELGESVARFEALGEPRGAVLKGDVGHFLEIILPEEVSGGGRGGLERGPGGHDEREDLLGPVEVPAEDPASEGDAGDFDRLLPFRARIGNFIDGAEIDERAGQRKKLIEVHGGGTDRVVAQALGNGDGVEGDGDVVYDFHGVPL